MSSDTPEFRTNISTPVSPIPIHVQEPQGIPVLRNQIDPVFNMTTTHTAPSDHSQNHGEPKLAAANNSTAQSSMANLSTDLREGRSPSSIIDDEDMEDAYGEEDKVQEVTPAVNAAEGGDDYAKTFDSDDIEEGEAENTSSNAVANPDLDQAMRSPLAPVSANENAISARIDPSPSETTSFHSAQEISPSFAQPMPSTQASVASKPGMPPIHSYEDVANGGVDIQQLLDTITANAENAEASKSANATSPTIKHGHSYSNSGNPSLPSHSSLPPRPQIHSKQPMHSSYVPHDDMRKFHAGPNSSIQAAYRPQGLPPIPIVAGAGAPGTSTDPRNGLPPPPVASFNSPIHLQAPGHAFSPARNSHLRVLSDQDSGEVSTNDGRDDTETPWPHRVQKQYDAFLEDERRYVTDGLWDIFPRGSRLFIGNLPTEKVTKRDIFHIFHRYGKLAQIAIKQAYGFVQFHTTDACQKALHREQGQELRGRKMHLEISKPQKNSQNSSRPGAVRAQSPEQARGNDRNNRNNRNTFAADRGYERGDRRGSLDRRGSFDKYDPRPNNGRWQGGRDDYRPRHSPPVREGYRGREDHGRDEFGRDRVRPRSRSRSPINNRREYRQRSPSPRSVEAAEDAALGLPRRNPRDVPDVQIILMEDLDRQFVNWVETEIRGLGLRTESLPLSARLPLPSVVRRQILEGVQAVCQLTRRSQITSSIPLQLFDHTKNPVTFDQYQDLEPKIAAQLVIRAKQTQQPAPVMPSYSAAAQYPPIQQQASQYPPSQHQQAPYQPPAVQAAVQPSMPNFSNVVNQLDTNALKNLIDSINAGNQQQQHQQNPSQNPQTQQQPAVNLAGLLGGFAQQQQQPNQMQQGYQQHMQPQNGGNQYNPAAALAGNPNFAAIFAQAQAQAQAQGQGQPGQNGNGQGMMGQNQGQGMGQSGKPDSRVTDIMAALSRFR